MEKLISKTAYMKQNHIGFKQLNEMIANGDLKVTSTGKIKLVGDDYVTKESFEKEKQRRIEAEKTLELIKNMLAVKG